MFHGFEVSRIVVRRQEPLLFAERNTNITSLDELRIKSKLVSHVLTVTETEVRVGQCDDFIEINEH